MTKLSKLSQSLKDNNNYSITRMFAKYIPLSKVIPPHTQSRMNKSTLLVRWSYSHTTFATLSLTGNGTVIITQFYFSQLRQPSHSTSPHHSYGNSPITSLWSAYYQLWHLKVTDNPSGTEYTTFIKRVSSNLCTWFLNVTNTVPNT
jgi:hypothetical protein